VGRVVVWRMSPYERRRGGNAPPGGLEAVPARVTPVPGKGALGTRWPRQSGTYQTQSWVTRGLQRGEGVRQTPPWRGEGCASTAVSRAGERPALRNGMRNRGQNRTREIRPSGIVEGLQETWPVGAFSTRRARLISIATTACTDRWGAGGNRRQSALAAAEPGRLSPARPAFGARRSARWPTACGTGHPWAQGPRRRQRSWQRSFPGFVGSGATTPRGSTTPNAGQQDGGG